MDTFIVGMPQEMYLDALHFFREAQAIEPQGGNEMLAIWRNTRAAILFGFAAVESCINQFIYEYVEKNKNNMSSSDILYWTEKTRNRPSIGKKLNEGVELFAGNGSRLDNDQAVWNDFQCLRGLRNQLVHYKPGSTLFHDAPKLLSRTYSALLTSAEVIKRIYSFHPSNPRYPAIFDELP